MPKFGSTSKKNMEGVHPLLIQILEILVKLFDVSVICGVRTTQEQQDLYAIGRTKDLNRKPVTSRDGVNKKSKHQIQEDGYGHAVDVTPYPIDWSEKHKNLARFYMMAGYAFAIADTVLEGTGYELRWGGDWDSDKDFADQNFDDLPHLELVFVNDK